MQAPRKKMNPVSFIRNSVPGIQKEWSSIRKRLDFSGALEIPGRKRRINRDSAFARLHCDELAVPFVELHVSPKIVKKRVKFTELNESESELNLNISICSSTSEDQNCDAEADDLPSTTENSCQQTPGRSVSPDPSTPKDGQFSSEFEDVGCTPIADLISKGETSKPQDWEEEFDTPVYDSNFRLGAKPEPGSSNSSVFTNLKDIFGKEGLTPLHMLPPPKVCRKIDILPSPKIGVRRSARSLSFSEG